MHGGRGTPAQFHLFATCIHLKMYFLVERVSGVPKKLIGGYFCLTKCGFQRFFVPLLWVRPGAVQLFSHLARPSTHTLACSHF